MNASFLWLSTEQEFGIVLPDEAKWNLIRNHRNELLARCDWTQIGDAPFTAEEKNTWTAYRQALRDMPQDYISPNDAIFPEQP